MSAKVQPIDVTDSAELLDLVEEVRRSGVGRLLMRGEEELALLTPVDARRRARRPQPASEQRDSLLNIIGIGESAEPTDIARDEQEYLARGIRAPMPVTDVLPVRPGRVFVDTSAYFAAANRRDAGHESVAALMWTLVEGRRRLVTTQLRPCRSCTRCC